MRLTNVLFAAAFAAVAYADADAAFPGAQHHGGMQHGHPGGHSGKGMHGNGQHPGGPPSDEGWFGGAPPPWPGNWGWFAKHAGGQPKHHPVQARDVGAADIDSDDYDPEEFDEENEFFDASHLDADDEDEDDSTLMRRNVEAAEEEADPNDPSPDIDYYDLGDDGDDEIMDNEIGDAQNVDDDESLGKIPSIASRVLMSANGFQTMMK